MRAPYPGELRVRVIQFVQGGASRREAAEQYDVSVSSAIRWVLRFREDGTAEPMPRGGSTSPLEEHAEQSSPLSVSSRTSLCERSSRRCISGESQGAAAHCRVFSLATSPLKKSLQAAERKRADVARARRRWIREQGCAQPLDSTLFFRGISFCQNCAGRNLTNANIKQ